MSEETKYSAVLSFEGGSLTVRRSGYGSQDGSGYFAWKDDELSWDEKDYRSIEIPKSDLIWLRDRLIEEFPTPSPQGAGVEALRKDLYGDDNTKRKTRLTLSLLSGTYVLLTYEEAYCVYHAHNDSPR